MLVKDELPIGFNERSLIANVVQEIPVYSFRWPWKASELPIAQQTARLECSVRHDNRAKEQSHTVGHEFFCKLINESFTVIVFSSIFVMN